VVLVVVEPAPPWPTAPPLPPVVEPPRAPAVEQAVSASTMPLASFALSNDTIRKTSEAR
jgi:hypothetical protein